MLRGVPKRLGRRFSSWLLLFACVLAHEFGHIFTARAFGVPTPDVTLLPIGGVARLERIPDTPHEEFLIAIAGPLVNVAIAFALIVLTGAHITSTDLTAVGSMHVALADRLAVVNFFLALFNMIPAFPMVGGFCGHFSHHGLVLCAQRNTLPRSAREWLLCSDLLVSCTTQC
jgi:Zn-dependent protease